MEAPNPSGKAAEVEPKLSHTQPSTLPSMQPASVVRTVEDEEDELADDDDVVMTDAATGSSAVSSQPQSTPVNLPRSARGAEGETTTAALAPASATPNVSATPMPSKKPHKPRAPKPEKSMMTSFKVRPPREPTVIPVTVATPSGPVQLNVVVPVVPLPMTEPTEAPKSSTFKMTLKGQMKKRSRREEPNDPNVQVFYHDDATGPTTAGQKNEYPPEAPASLVPPAPSKTRSSSKQRAIQPEPPTEFFSIPVAEPLDLNGQPPKKWDTSYRTIQTISGATFRTRVWKSNGVKAEPLKPPPNWVLAPMYPNTSSGSAQAGSAADKAAGGAGTGTGRTGTPTGAPVKRGRKSKAELAVLAAAAADGTRTPVGKRSKAPKKPKKEKVGKSALGVDEPESGAVTPSLPLEDVEMVPAS